jgi:hypothetical protein
LSPELRILIRKNPYYFTGSGSAATKKFYWSFSSARKFSPDYLALRGAKLLHLPVQNRVGFKATAAAIAVSINYSTTPTNQLSKS